MAGKNNNEIYELINALRLEIKGDIQGVAETVGKRLDKIEDNQQKTDDKVNKIVTAQATTNLKVGVISFIGSSMAGAIIAGIVGKLIK